MIEESQIINTIEAVLFASDKPLNIAKLAEIFPDTFQVEKNQIKNAILKLQEIYSDRAVELKEVASGYTFMVKHQYGEWVTRLWTEKPQKYSRAFLETLAIIAYRQPVTRADIEDIRGVTVSSQVIKTLLEREWIRIVGHRDVPGKPALLATTKQFLDYFGLKSLDEMPALSEIKSLDIGLKETDLQPEPEAAENTEQTFAQDETQIVLVSPPAKSLSKTEC